MVTASTIKYRLSLQPFHRFEITTRVLGWTSASSVRSRHPSGVTSSAPAESRVADNCDHTLYEVATESPWQRTGPTGARPPRGTAIPGGDDVKHLRWLQDKLGDDLLDAVLITTGPAAYRRDDGIAVVPAELLGP